jgi:hypothetical protein
MESESAETRKQTIAKLQEEIKKLNELKDAEIRLDAAQKTLYIARQEYNAAEKIRNNLLESVQKGVTIGGRRSESNTPSGSGRIFTCRRHPLSTHPYNFSTKPGGECPNCECSYE